MPALLAPMPAMGWQAGAKYDWIGDVRGYGLFFGAEIVTNRTNKAPAPACHPRCQRNAQARRVGEQASITATTLKIRPPMPFSRANADFMLETLDGVLADPLAYATKAVSLAGLQASPRQTIFRRPMPGARPNRLPAPHPAGQP